MMETTSMQDDVQRMIEGWVTECQENELPWEQQKQTLGVRICQLAQKAEEETSKQGTMTNDGDDIDSGDEKSATTSKKDAEDLIKASISAPPTTLLELLHYILSLFTDEQLQKEKLDIVRVRTNERTGTLISFVSRVEFQQELDTIAVHEINRVYFGMKVYKETDLHEAYDQIQDRCFPSSKIVQSINAAGWSFDSTRDVLPWDPTLVGPMSEGDFDSVKFATDYSKGAALVISGESGSGKTWFAQNYIPRKLGKQNLALIYYCVDSDDGHRRIQSHPQGKQYMKACQFCMHALMEAGYGKGEVYDSVSKLSMHYSSNRDALAYEWLKKVIGKSLYRNSNAWKWWNLGERSYGAPVVEKLVLVIDEVGKNPDLACGLVSIVQQVYQDITVTLEKAKDVLLVLVGSGSDWYIRNDHLPYAGDDRTRNEYSTFGTDPRKSHVIILKGPNLSQKEKLDEIPTSAISKGTYSSTLATNTRMLTRGVLHMLKHPNFAVRRHDKSAESDYEDLGSTNIVMDYAPRLYISLGGLRNLMTRPALFDKMLLTQFRLLLWERQFAIKDSNPAAAKLLENLKIVGLDFHQTLSLGIVTSDIKSTSAALRYLACDGFSAPNVAKGGIEFDIIVQHHLVRFYQAMNSVQNDTRDSKQKRTKYWAGHYNLKQAWPPRSLKEDVNLWNRIVTWRRVKAMYKGRMELNMERNMSNGYDEEIDAIIALVKGKQNFDLVMRQQVHDLQGANLMSLGKTNGKYSLDLYYSNHEIKLSGIQTDEFKRALQRLGVNMEPKRKRVCIKTSPRYGAAGYTYQGTTIFAEKLGKRLGAKVEIRQRTMIFPRGWDGQPADYGFLQQALDKGVMVWTREMLEPTLTALKSQERL